MDGSFQTQNTPFSVGQSLESREVHVMSGGIYAIRIELDLSSRPQGMKESYSACINMPNILTNGDLGIVFVIPVLEVEICVQLDEVANSTIDPTQPGLSPLRWSCMAKNICQREHRPLSPTTETLRGMCWRRWLEDPTYFRSWCRAHGGSLNGVGKVATATHRSSVLSEASWLAAGDEVECSSRTVPPGQAPAPPRPQKTSRFARDYHQ